MNRLSPERRRAVEELVLSGGSQRDIVSATGCSASTIQNIKREMRERGTVLPPTQTGGWPAHKTPATDCIHHWRIDGGESCRCEGEPHHHAVCATCGTARSFPSVPETIFGRTPTTAPENGDGADKPAEIMPGIIPRIKNDGNDKASETTKRPRRESDAWGEELAARVAHGRERRDLAAAELAYWTKYVEALEQLLELEREGRRT